MVSRGLCVGKFTYLRNPWNWPDVAIIAAAYEGTVVASLHSAFVFQPSACFVVFLFPVFFGFVAIFKPWLLSLFQALPSPLGLFFLLWLFSVCYTVAVRQHYYWYCCNLKLWWVFLCFRFLLLCVHFPALKTVALIWKMLPIFPGVCVFVFVCGWVGVRVHLCTFMVW